MSADPERAHDAAAEDTEGLVRIGELAELAGVPVATVRHYLREGLLPEGVKSAPNMAYYEPELAERIRRIKQLQEERYLPLRVIREIVGPGAERLEAAELRERTGIPKRALERLSELGVISSGADGYSRADARIVEAIAAFRDAGWDERAGFGAHDVQRLMAGLDSVIDDELALLGERFSALDPERAEALAETGGELFARLIGALHAKRLNDELARLAGG